MRTDNPQGQHSHSRPPVDTFVCMADIMELDYRKRHGCGSDHNLGLATIEGDGTLALALTKTVPEPDGLPDERDVRLVLSPAQIRSLRALLGAAESALTHRGLLTDAPAFDLPTEGAGPSGA